MRVFGFTALLGIFIVCLIWYVFEELRRRFKNYPPSPGVRLPLIGHIYLFRSKPPQDILHQWADDLGEIFYIDIGPAGSAVFLNSPQIVHEAFVKNGKFYVDRGAGDGKGAIMSSGKEWRFCRSLFVLNLMQNLNAREEVIQECLMELYGKLQVLAEKNEPFDPEQLFKKTTFKIIASLFFGQRVLSDEDAAKVMKSFDLAISYGAHALICEAIPFFGNSLKEIFMKERMDYDRFVKKLIRQLVEDHRQKLGDEPKDFIDKLLILQKTDSNFGDDSIAQVVEDAIVAGLETTSVFTHWFVLLMARFPQVQTKLQEELHAVVGPNRLSNLDDLGSLPFCDAVIKEVMRFRTINPITLPAYIRQELKLQGYTIPKGTNVFQNVYHLHLSNSLWNGIPANEFAPQRFLEEEKEIQMKGSESRTNIGEFKFIPFGCGRRSCAGAPLAKIQLFYFASQLCHLFSFTPQKGKEVNLQPRFGFTLKPQNQLIHCSLQKTSS
jgi:cytochrome P450